MWRWLSIPALALVASLTAGCTGRLDEDHPPPAAQTQPYAELAGRPIKALAPERVADLLAGRGAGYALAAELNHYPGPTHVLDLAARLQLRSDQEQRVREVFTAMQEDARRYGKQLVDLEAELDRAFSGGAISRAELARLTADIAATEGRVRDVHLAAHLEMKSVLTAEQVARYDELRGYAATGAAGSAGDDGRPTGEHSGDHQRH
ncbi:MAG: Spy/CpxP family protein refolding chaperone [Chloroflexi bacterium]|nr:Spy/CpxP family protein refolding chaperone [Chloroflexota bacterium]